METQQHPLAYSQYARAFLCYLTGTCIVIVFLVDKQINVFPFSIAYFLYRCGISQLNALYARLH